MQLKQASVQRIAARSDEIARDERKIGTQVIALINYTG